MKHKNLIRMLALGLSVLMLLCGCDSLDNKPDVPGSPLPSESESAPQEEKPTDYSKYNSYLHLADQMDEVMDVLDVYFTNVEFEEEFALVEGGDYAAIKDAVQFYTGITFQVEEALSYADKEPAYARVDAAVRAFGDSPVQLMEAVDDLAGYMRFDEFEDDNMAQAAEIHAAIWEPLQVFMTCYSEFIYALDELADQTRGEDLENMLQSGEMILYYSNVMIYASQDILDEIWDQYELAAMAALEEDPNAEFSLPEVDMTELSPLFGQFNDAYDGLTEAMADEEEQEKVFTGPLAESTMNLYTTKVDSLYFYMGTLAQVLLDGSDYSEAFNNASDALSSMISGYNSII